MCPAWILPKLGRYANSQWGANFGQVLCISMRPLMEGVQGFEFKHFHLMSRAISVLLLFAVFLIRLRKISVVSVVEVWNFFHVGCCVPEAKQLHHEEDTLYPRVINSTDITSSNTETASLQKRPKYKPTHQNQKPVTKPDPGCGNSHHTTTQH